MKIDFNEVAEEIKKLNEKEKTKGICPICNKKLPEDSHPARKYHPECSIKVAKARMRICSRKYGLDKNQKKRIWIYNMIKRNEENPQCNYFQGGRCVRKSIKFEGMLFYPHGGKCEFKPRDKCPSFKPKYPDIYELIKKIKKNENKTTN